MRCVLIKRDMLETDMHLAPRWEPVRIIVEGGCAAWTTEAHVCPIFSVLEVSQDKGCAL